MKDVEIVSLGCGNGGGKNVYSQSDKYGGSGSGNNHRGWGGVIYIRIVAVVDGFVSDYWRRVMR